MDREKQKELARRRRNDVTRIRAYIEKWVRREWYFGPAILGLVSPGFDPEKWIYYQVRLLERSRPLCSCPGCGNPRRHGIDGRITRKEQKFLDSMKDQIGSVD